MLLKSLVRKLKKIFFYQKYFFFRRLRMFLKIDQKILIKNHELILPPGHLLSLYDYLYPEYDEFISKLVVGLDKNQSAIDIGANVGDTLIRLINSNSKIKYYSIEADKYFFKYLKKNTERITSIFKTRITLIEKLVGINLTGNLSKTSTGTKTLIENTSGMKSRKLDEIILDYKIENIALIKVDVDGYDFNVLLSGMEYITKYKPKLFFEYMSLNKNGYIEIINKLSEVGYKNWTVLNNYGQVIFENKKKSDVIEILSNYNANKIIDIFCSS